MTRNPLVVAMMFGHLGLAAWPAVCEPVAAQGLAPQASAPPYTDAQAYAQAQSAISTNLSGPLNMAAGSTIGGAAIATTSALSSYETQAAAVAAFQPLGSYQAAGNYATASALSSLAGSAVMSVAGVAPVSGNVPLTIASIGNVASVNYIHHYASASMTVPVVGLGAIGTGTIAIAGVTGLPAPAVGDLCIVSPTAPTTALGYMIGTGWVTTAGTVKVALEAGTLVAISSGTLGVNVLCMQ